MSVRSVSAATVVLAALLGVAAGQTTDLYVDEGACPGEGCAYGRWRAQSDVVVYDKPGGGASAMGVILAGQRVRALTGQVHTVPGMFRVHREHGRYRPGDVIEVLTYQGEGFFSVRFRGEIYEEELGFSPWGGIPDSRCADVSDCFGVLDQELDFTWWVEVYFADGARGWIRDPRDFHQKAAGPAGQSLLASADYPGLAEAVSAAHPRARGWTVRVSDTSWAWPVEDSLEVWVDYPAESLVGRVGWHRYSHCTRADRDSDWTCAKRRRKSLPRLEVRPQTSAAAAECSAVPIRGIQVGAAVPLGVVAELTDYVRLDVAGRRTIDAMCRPGLERAELSESELCDVGGVWRSGEDAFEVSLRVLPAHFVIPKLQRVCAEGECETRIVGCREIVS